MVPDLLSVNFETLILDIINTFLISFHFQFFAEVSDPVFYFLNQIMHIVLNSIM